MKELIKNIGKTGTIHIARTELKVEVKITDVKQVYGNDRYLVTPVAGIGETWVQDITINE